MNFDLAALPDDIATLQHMVRTLAVDRAALTQAQAEIERLRLIVQKLQRSQFGRRAERLDNDQLQFGFEDLEAISHGPKPSLRRRAHRRRGPARGPIGQVCRGICLARTYVSISNTKPAPVAGAPFI